MQFQPVAIEGLLIILVGLPPHPSLWYLAAEYTMY